MQAGRDSAAFPANGHAPVVASGMSGLPALAPATVGLDPLADVNMQGGAGQSPIYDRFATSGNAVANGAPQAASADGEHAKAKQKRNKPTLSCLECVERKTKCDRARPCLACVKRQSSCEYTAVANLIASASARALAITPFVKTVIARSSPGGFPCAILGVRGWCVNPSLARVRVRSGRG